MTENNILKIDGEEIKLTLSIDAIQHYEGISSNNSISGFVQDFQRSRAKLKDALTILWVALRESDSDYKKISYNKFSEKLKKEYKYFGILTLAASIAADAMFDDDEEDGGPESTEKPEKNEKKSKGV